MGKNPFHFLVIAMFYYLYLVCIMLQIDRPRNKSGKSTLDWVVFGHAAC